jgi:hypothetical protein
MTKTPQSSRDSRFTLDDRDDPAAALTLSVDAHRAIAGISRHELRSFILTVAEERGEARAEQYVPAPAPDALEIMLPRTRWHLRLGQTTKAEIEQVLTLAGAIFTATGDWKKATAASLRTLLDRLSGLRINTGELSVAEAIGSSGASTKQGIEEFLHGRLCPHVEAGCRLLSLPDRCAIDLQTVDQIVDSLVARQVLVADGPVPPVRYSLVV